MDIFKTMVIVCLVSVTLFADSMIELLARRVVLSDSLTCAVNDARLSVGLTSDDMYVDPNSIGLLTAEQHEASNILIELYSVDMDILLSRDLDPNTYKNSKQEIDNDLMNRFSFILGMEINHENDNVDFD